MTEPKPEYSTWADIDIDEEHQLEYEKEYRRGYCDGFISLANVIGYLWFLGKNRIYDYLFNFWQYELDNWKFNIRGRMEFPPECDVKCVYCGKPAQHLDHIYPKSRGGSNDESNLVPACANCNISKHAKTPQEWKGIIGNVPKGVE